jgi:hypothetical protein
MMSLFYPPPNYNTPMKRNHMTREETLTALFGKIRDSSQQFLSEELLEEELPTAASLARDFNLRLEEVKKRLDTLREADLIQAVSMNPKRYRLNAWRIKSAEKETDHPLRFLFVEATDADAEEWEEDW